MSNSPTKDENPSTITIFIKTPLKRGLIKWLHLRESLNHEPIIKIKDLAISVSFDYKQLSFVTKKLDSLKLINEKDYIILAI